jgi:hypothetical protein
MNTRIRPPRFLPKVWADPVWSKVIASVIMAVGGLLCVMLFNSKRSQTGFAPLPISLRITSPAPGAVVESGAAVSFTSPFENLGHYIVVIPLRSPDRYVVDGPLHVSADRTTSGRARFGNEAAGIGEQFAIQVIATKTPLVEGVLAQLPEDAKLSSQVIVNRAR